MDVHDSESHMAQHHIYINILKTLLRIAPLHKGSEFPPPESWPSTRQIADANDMSIYKARLLLLELAKHELVIAGKSSGNNSLRWYPLTTNISPIIKLYRSHQHSEQDVGIKY